MCICEHVCMYVRMHVCMYAYLHAHTAGVEYDGHIAPVSPNSTIHIFAAHLLAFNNLLL